MNIKEKGFIHFLGLIILLVGLVAAVLIIKDKAPQIFKSKASANVMDAFTIKDSQGRILNCDGSVNPSTCITDSPDVTIEAKDLSVLEK